MKLATCEVDGRCFLGVVSSADSLVLDVARLAADAGRSDADVGVLSDMPALLRSGTEGLDIIAELAGAADWDSAGFRMSEVKFRPPIEYPGKLLCLAGNYAAHIEEFAKKVEKQDMETPRFFMKPSTNTVVGDGDAIVLPAASRAVDWEGELAVVIGLTASRVSEEGAMRHVAGYTIMNDVSERRLKIWERSSNRPKDEWFDWLNGKWCDTFAPMGPWIVTADEIADPHSLEITTKVNGEVRQRCSTAAMIFKIPALIAYISSIVTLEPGDVISTGTIAGVGAATGTYLSPGDEVEVSISSIGSLRSKVASE